MEHLEYTVFTKASPSLAWEMFCDYRLWPRFSDVYGDICWSKGKPWTAGSRLKIEIVRPQESHGRSRNYHLLSGAASCVD